MVSFEITILHVVPGTCRPMLQILLYNATGVVSISRREMNWKTYNDIEHCECNVCECTGVCTHEKVADGINSWPSY